MSLIISSEEAERLARKLAQLTGESVTGAVTVALRERLERLRDRDSAAADRRRERLRAISAAAGGEAEMQADTAIVFVTAITGERRAALAAGPEVWTVAESWLQHGEGERSAAAVADATGLTPAQVQAALGYWAANRAEIDELVARQHASQDAALAAWERQRARPGG